MSKSNYILLLTLTPAGRERMLTEPGSLLEAAERVSVPDVEVLGLYGVLGGYDFISIVEAADNETMALYWNSVFVRGAQVETLPAIPIARFQGGARQPSDSAAASLSNEPEAVSPESDGNQRQS